jgi:hypothetical protein
MDARLTQLSHIERALGQALDVLLVLRCRPAAQRHIEQQRERVGVSVSV